MPWQGGKLLFTEPVGHVSKKDFQLWSLLGYRVNPLYCFLTLLLNNTVIAFFGHLLIQR